LNVFKLLATSPGSIYPETFNQLANHLDMCPVL